MTTIETFEKMSQHARQSCRVNGLMPSQWCLGPDMEEVIINVTSHLPLGTLPYIEGLPVYRMKADGVACIGRRAQPLLGIKPLFGQQ